MASEQIRGRRNLVASNSSDAAGRSIADLVIDLVFVSVLGANALEMGLMNALGSIAFVFVSLPVGVLVDRYRPVRILRIGLSAKLAVVLLLLVLVGFDRLSIPLGLFLTTLLGICNVFTETAQVSAVPGLSEAEGPGREHSIARLIAVLTSADQALGIIIPAAAGVGFALLGAAPLLAVSAALALMAILFALRIALGSAPTPPSSSSLEQKVPGEYTVGLGFLRSNKTLLALTILVSCSNAGLAIGSAVEALFIINYLALGPQWYGILAAVGGLGGLAGAALAPKVIARFKTAHITVFTTIAQILLSALVLVAAFTDSRISVILLIIQNLLWGLVVITFNISASTWSTSITPEHLLGRVTSARRMFTFGSVPVASLAGGAVGTMFGIPAALACWTAVTCLGLGGFLAFNREPQAALSDKLNR